MIRTQDFVNGKEEKIFKITAYKCAYCGLLSEESRDIEQHLDKMFVPRGLPTGLVFKQLLPVDQSYPYAVVEWAGIDHNHAVSNLITYLRKIDENRSNAGSGICYNSFKQGLMDGSFSFLEEKEFQKFEELNQGLLKDLKHVKKFIRVVPELEKLLKT